MKQISFLADKIRVNGPKVDGSYTVTFETGEYEQENVAKVLSIPQQTVVRVIIVQDETESTEEILEHE